MCVRGTTSSGLSGASDERRVRRGAWCKDARLDITANILQGSAIIGPAPYVGLINAAGLTTAVNLLFKYADDT